MAGAGKPAPVGFLEGAVDIHEIDSSKDKLVENVRYAFRIATGPVDNDSERMPPVKSVPLKVD